MATKASPFASRKPAGKLTKIARSRVGAAVAPGAAKTVASQLPPVTAAQTAAAKKKFEQGILVRGEAVLTGKPLPTGATHEIVGKRRDGSPILKRKRFSIT